MNNAKVHVAGIPFGDQQRCIRCCAKILDNSFIGSISFWPVGSLIRSRRGGMQIITADEAKAFRPCGRGATQGGIAA